MLKNAILQTQKFPNMHDQIATIQNNRKSTYIFGGLGAMSVGSVIANYFLNNNIPFEGFLVNKSFMNKNNYMGKPVFAIEEANFDKESNIIIGISKWSIAKNELDAFGYKNTFIFDCFSENILEPINLDYFLKYYDGFYATYTMLEDRLSKASMISYLQGKIFNNFTELSKTCLEALEGGGHTSMISLPLAKMRL